MSDVWHKVHCLEEENAQLRAELARMTAKRGDLRSGLVHPSFHREVVEKLEAERDAAIARAVAAERDRDEALFRLRTAREHVPQYVCDDDPGHGAFGVLCCPLGEPGHFWKDGCPADCTGVAEGVPTAPPGPKPPAEVPPRWFLTSCSVHGRASWSDYEGCGECNRAHAPKGRR